MRFEKLASAKCYKCEVAYGDGVFAKIIETPRIYTVKNMVSLRYTQRAVANIYVVCPHCLIKSKRTVVREITPDDLEQLIYRGDFL